jgi:hypothetical protein
MTRARSRPSPALIVSIVALVAALAGTAVAANPTATSSAINKKKVKKIANTQIDKRLPWGTADIADRAVTSEKLADGAVAREKIAGGAVNNAKVEAGSLSANRLTAQARVDLRGSLAYAQVDDNGPALVAARTRNITGVTRPSPGVYCFTVAPSIADRVFAANGSPIVATVGNPEFGNTTITGDELVAPRGGNNICGNNRLEVETFNGGVLANDVAFTLNVP